MEEKERKTEAEVDGQCIYIYLDLREKGPSGAEMQNWAMWRQIVRNIDLT